MAHGERQYVIPESAGGGYPGSYENENIFIGSRIMAFGHFRDDNFYEIRSTRYEILNHYAQLHHKTITIDHPHAYRDIPDTLCGNALSSG